MRSFAVLWAACAAVFLSLGMTVTAVPRYVSGPLDGGTIAVGLSIGALALGALLVRPFAGAAADSRGRRTVALAGAAVATVAGLAYLPHLGLGGLLAARVLHGLGTGAVFTAGLAWADDLAPDGRRGRLLGLFGLSIWLSFALGPLLADAVYGASGFTAVWLVGAACPALGGLLVACLRETAPVTAAGDAAPVAVRRQVLPRAARRPGAVIALASTSHAVLAGFAVLMLEARDVGHASLVFSAFAGGLVLARLVFGGLPDRLGPERCAVGSALGQAAGLAVLAAAARLDVALAGAALVGAGYSVMYPSMALMVVREAPADQRGAALGAFTGFYDLGIGTAAPAIGAVVALTGYVGGFAVAIAAALLSISVLTLRRSPSCPPWPATT